MEGGCVHRLMGPRQCNCYPEGRGEYRGRAVGAVSQQKCRNPVTPALSIVDSEKGHSLGRPELACFYQEQQVSEFPAPSHPKTKPQTLEACWFEGGTTLVHLLPVPPGNNDVPGAAGFSSPETGSSGWCLMVLPVCLSVWLSVRPSALVAASATCSGHLLCWSGFAGLLLFPLVFAANSRWMEASSSQ